MDDIVTSGTQGLNSNVKDRLSQQEKQICELQQVVGEQALHIRVLKKFRDCRTGRERILRCKTELEAEGISISIRKFCGWLEVPRAAVYRESTQRRRYKVNDAKSRLLSKRSHNTGFEEFIGN